MDNQNKHMRKIDIFNHVWPAKFFKALIEHIGQLTDITRGVGLSQ